MLSDQEASTYKSLIQQYEQNHPRLIANKDFMLDEMSTTSVHNQIRTMVEDKVKYYVMASIAAVKFLNNEVRNKKKRQSGT